jgi:hypothetical protein
LKAAVAERLAEMVRTQLPVPLQLPVHPAKLWPFEEVAVRVTLVPCKYVALQPLPTALPEVMVQAIAGVSPAWLATVPLPSPPPLTLRAKDGVPAPEKVALTERDWVITTLHSRPVPVHAPLQPVKLLPPCGVAVNWTWVFQP